MRFIENTYYEVKDPRGVYGLAERFVSLENAVKGGQSMNETETKEGFKVSPWIVTRTTWNRCFDDDGSFISESSTTIKMSIDSYLDEKEDR